MRNSSSEKYSVPMSAAERIVKDALFDLPADYHVDVEPNDFSSSGELMSRLGYWPDFEVTNGRGQRLLIEVKSEHAMSLPNMVRFVQIDNAIRRDPLSRFLILIFGAAKSTRFAARPEFKQLQIRYVRRALEVHDVVEQEFHAFFAEPWRDATEQAGRPPVKNF